MRQLKRLTDRYPTWTATVWGIAAVCLFFGAWCCSTISYQGKIFYIAYMIISLFSAGCYLLCLQSEIKCAGFQPDRSQNDHRIVQLKILNVVLALYFVLMLVWDIRYEQYKTWYLAADVIYLLAAGWGGRQLKYSWRNYALKIKGLIRENKELLILLFIALLFAIEPGELQFRWDGALYEQECRNVMNIHSLSSIGALGHLSQAFGSVYCLLYAVTGNTGLAMAAMNILLYLGSICGFYKLIKLLAPDKNRYTYLAGTAVYTFSPFLLGMVNYYSLDYMTLCLFVWVVYFAFSKQWILHFVLAAMFAFTKEPAIVSYGAFCAGIVLADFVKDGKEPFTRRLKRIITKPEYYLMMMIGFFWLIMYKMLGGWSAGEGNFGFSGRYTIEKLKVLYLLNFNWLMLIAIFISGIVWIRKKEKTENGVWWRPLLVSLAAFTIFSVIFKTVNHARYAATAPISLYILAVVSLLSVMKESICRLFMGIIAGIFLLSCYRTIDPVSLICFEKMDIGSRTMITTGELSIGDMMIYNKQMLGEETAFNLALEEAVNNGYEIYVPTFNGKPYYFDGSMLQETVEEGYRTVTGYWNSDKRKRVGVGSERTIPFILNEIDGDVVQVLREQRTEGKQCFIYAPWIGEEEAARIEDGWPDSKLNVYRFAGWNIYMIVF